MTSEISSPVLAMPQKTHRHKDLPIYAVLEIETPPNWKPHHVSSTPCDGLGNVPGHLTAEFAGMFNASHHAICKHRWACCPIGGSIVFIPNIDETIRPIDPLAYPPNAITGLTKAEAETTAIAANMETLRVARVPRRWTIALRPLEPIAGATAEVGDA